MHLAVKFRLIDHVPGRGVCPRSRRPAPRRYAKVSIPPNFSHRVRTVYGWPLGKGFVWSPDIWSVAAMYAASDLRRDLPRALMESAGMDGSRSMARDRSRTGSSWVARPSCLRLMPSPHAAPYHLGAAGRVRRRSLRLSAWRSPVAVAMGYQCPDRAGHAGGQRDGHEFHRLARQHPVQPVGGGSCGGCTPSPPGTDPGHGAQVEQPPQIPVPRLADPPQPLLAA